MSKSITEYTMSFKPPLAAGTIVVAFGVVCIWIGTSSHIPKYFPITKVLIFISVRRICNEVKKEEIVIQTM